MGIVRVKRKSVNITESVTNAENIMPAQNVRDLVKKRGPVSCLADELTWIGKGP